MRRRSEEECLRSNLKRVKMKGAIFCKITIGRLIDPRFMAIHAVQDNRNNIGSCATPPRVCYESSDTVGVVQSKCRTAAD